VYDFVSILILSDIDAYLLTDSNREEIALFLQSLTISDVDFNLDNPSNQPLLTKVLEYAAFLLDAATFYFRFIAPIAFVFIYRHIYHENFHS
jgi:hypothetical protein